MSDDEFNDTILTATTTSKTYPMRCSALRKDGHVVIEGRPCKIVDISILETSEGGDAQVHLVALDIFTGKQFEDTSLSTDVMEVPNVSRHEYQLVNIDDGFLNLRTGDGVPKDDIRVPEGDLGSGMERDFHDGNEILVTVIGAMNEEAAISYKNVL